MREIRAGLIDADLGAGLIKKRIPVDNRGKRGGARTILASAQGPHSYFIFGYLKNEQEDLGPEDLISLRVFAIELLVQRDEVIKNQLKQGGLQEICHGN